MNTSDIARALGRKGGRARARRLSASERQRIAALGGVTRKRSLDVARRIAENFRYAAATDELRGRPGAVRRLARCAGPLPDIRAGTP